MLKDGSKQSSIVTKRFTVYEAEEVDNDDTEEEEAEMVYEYAPIKLCQQNNYCSIPFPIPLFLMSKSILPSSPYIFSV